MPQQLLQLVDRNARISIVFVVLFIIAGMGAVGAWLYVESWSSDSYRVLHLIAQIRLNNDRADMSLNAYLRTGRPQSAETWKSSVKASRHQLAALQGIVRRDDLAGLRVDQLGQLLEHKVGAANTLLQTYRAGSADIARRQLADGPYPRLDADLKHTLRSMASGEQALLVHKRAHQRWSLFAIGTVLLGLAMLGLLAVLRARRTARVLATELETAYRTMAINQAELTSLSDASPMGLLHVDSDGTPTYLNAKAREIVGAQPDDDYLAVWSAAIHPDDRSAVLAARNRMVAEKRDVSGVYRVVRKDGRIVWVSAHMTTLRPADEVIGFVGVVADVTAEHELRASLAQNRALLQQMTDAVPALMAYIDKDEIYRFVNRTYVTWFGAENAPEVGDTLHSFVGDTAYAVIRPYKEAVLAGESVHFEVKLRNLHNRPFWADITYTPNIAENGDVPGFHVLVTDLSERKQLEEQLFEAMERAQITLEAIGDAVVTTDAEGLVTFMNPRAEALLECPFSEANGQSVNDVIRVVDTQGRPSNTSLLRAIAENRTVDVLQPRKLILADGLPLDIEDVAAPMHDRDGTVIGGVLVLRDVSVAQAVADRMRHLAEYDPLTGLPNRLLFEDRALQAIHQAMRNNNKVGMLFLDLDGFKDVNDTWGHETGDELLKQVSFRLSDTLRRSDSVSRLGGDEFVVLMPDLKDTEGAICLAEKLVAAGKRPFRHHGHRLDVTFSVGIAMYPDHGTDVHKLLRESDRALYNAKLSGKGCYAMAKVATSEPQAAENIKSERLREP